MSRNVILGVDPGLKGALAFWHPTAELLETFAMPTLTVKRSDGKKRDVIDLMALGRILLSRGPKVRTAFVEEVGSRPDQGSSSGFKFGKVTGIVIGAIAAHLVPVKEVPPAVWKRHMGVTLDRLRLTGLKESARRKAAKDASIAKASTLLPLYAPQWTPPAHNAEVCGGIAEATLIAIYGARLK